MKTPFRDMMSKLGVNLETATFVGLAGGMAVSIGRAGIAMLRYAPPHISLKEMLSISLFPIVLYILLNMVAMAVAGLIMAFLFHLGDYDFKKSELGAFYCGIFAALSVSMAGDEGTAAIPSMLRACEGAVSALLYGLAVGVMVLFVISRMDKKRLSLLIAVSLIALTVLPYPLICSIKGAGPRARENPVPMVDAGKRPNILWVVNDAMRADHLSCYGYRRATTPCIDRVAQEGVLWAHAYSASSWTLPSMASMFTGMFPSKHGADGEHFYLDGKFSTFAEVAQHNGYMTCGFSNNPYVSRSTNLARGFAVFDHARSGVRLEGIDEQKLIREAFPALRNVQLPGVKSDKGASRTNRLVMDSIKEAHNQNRPFFIFIDYMETHTFHGETSYDDRWFKDKPSPQKALKIRNSMGWHEALTREKELTQVERQDICDLYDGDISYLDARLGEIFDYLGRLEILDDTIVIITSDHGENLGEHGHPGHMFSIRDSLLHVPLVIRYPRAFRNHSKVETMVQTTDIFPTLLDLTDIRWDGWKELQGYSLARGPGRPDCIIAELGLFIPGLNHIMTSGEPPGSSPGRTRSRGVDAFPYANRLKAIRTGTHKYIWNSNGRDELYRISDDPGELNNIIESNSTKAQELRDRLRAWLNSFEGYGGRSSNRL
jgi:arylsulfatase A-like enzyme